MSDLAEVIIREAGVPDAPALIETIGRIDEETEFLGLPGEARRAADGFADRLRAMGTKVTGVYFIAVHADEIIGFLGAFPGWFARARGAVHIGHIGLRRAWRGKGIGTRLFRAIEDWAIARGAWRLDLRVDEENGPALALYRRRGFTTEGRIVDAMCLDGRWHAHLFMAKPLRVLPEPDFAPLEPTPAAVAAGEVSFRMLRDDDGPRLGAYLRRFLDATPFLIRRSDEVADAEAMSKILTATLASPVTFQLVAVARDGDEEVIVGYLGTWREPTRRLDHDIQLDLTVLPDYWGRNIGRTLVERLEGWARQRGARRLTTFVLGHNARGLRFASACHFSREVVSPRFAVIDDRAVDRVRLAKLLVEEK